ncbi:MAG: MotA/TolQ/ExbB proton channel family protein [Candidatus Eremiobacteraeota bacterium]|nr:MotA/TolQ/ExbB proton channel family protein [Candidatus Eremiobacteraeota bacterium]
MQNPISAIAEFLNKGGVTMYMLVFCSILMFAVVAERLYSLWKISIDSEWLIQQLALFLQDRKISETVEYLRVVPGILPRVLESGLIRYDKEKDEIETALANTITEQTPVLERFVSILGTIAVISPFLGLLGTILGIIKAFNNIAQQGTTGAAVIAQGIYEALYTTAAGLIIAIPAVIFYNYFRSRIRNIITEMEVCSNRLVEMIILSRKGEPFPEDLLPEGYEPKVTEKK